MNYELPKQRMRHPEMTTKGALPGSGLGRPDGASEPRPSPSGPRGARSSPRAYRCRPRRCHRPGHPSAPHPLGPHWGRPPLLREGALCRCAAQVRSPWLHEAPAARDPSAPHLHDGLQIPLSLPSDGFVPIRWPCPALAAPFSTPRSYSASRADLRPTQDCTQPTCPGEPSSGLHIEFSNVRHLTQGGWVTFCPMERDPQGPLNPTPESRPRDSGPFWRKGLAARLRADSKVGVCASEVHGQRLTRHGAPDRSQGSGPSWGCALKLCMWPLGTQAEWALTCLPPAAGPPPLGLVSSARRGQ